MSINFSVSFLLALVAAVCAVLMLLGKRFNRVPLAAIAILCLALNQLGIFR